MCTQHNAMQNAGPVYCRFKIAGLHILVFTQECHFAKLLVVIAQCMYSMNEALLKSFTDH